MTQKYVSDVVIGKIEGINGSFNGGVIELIKRFNNLIAILYKELSDKALLRHSDKISKIDKVARVL